MIWLVGWRFELPTIGLLELSKELKHTGNTIFYIKILLNGLPKVRFWLTARSKNKPYFNTNIRPVNISQGIPNVRNITKWGIPLMAIKFNPRDPKGIPTYQLSKVICWLWWTYIGRLTSFTMTYTKLSDYHVHHLWFSQWTIAKILFKKWVSTKDQLVKKRLVEKEKAPTNKAIENRYRKLH